MTPREKAKVVLELMNEDKPHGMSSKDWLKKYDADGVLVASKKPEKKNDKILDDSLPMSAIPVNSKVNKIHLEASGPMGGKGPVAGADFKVEYGNRQQYPLVPLSISKILGGAAMYTGVDPKVLMASGGAGAIPGISSPEDIAKLTGLDKREYNMFPTSGISIQSIDGNDLISIPGIDIEPYEKARLEKKGKNGFIHDQDVTIPYTQDAGWISAADMKNGNLVLLKKSQLNKVLGLKEPTLGKRGLSRDEYKRRIKGAGMSNEQMGKKCPKIKNPKRQKRQPTKGSEFMNVWQDYAAKVKKQPFMKHVKYDKNECRFKVPHMLSMLYELDKELTGAGYGVEERDKVIDLLNKDYSTEMIGGADGLGIVYPDHVIKSLVNIRKRLNETTNRAIPIKSKKLSEIKARNLKSRMR